MITVSLEKTEVRVIQSQGSSRATDDSIVTSESTKTVGVKMADVNARVRIPYNISVSNG